MFCLSVHQGEGGGERTEIERLYYPSSSSAAASRWAGFSHCSAFDTMLDEFRCAFAIKRFYHQSKIDHTIFRHYYPRLSVSSKIVETCFANGRSLMAEFPGNAANSEV